jgi:hypothetical protein
LTPGWFEKAKADKGRLTASSIGEFGSEHRGYCVAQDTFYVGTLEGVGRIYQQTAIDTCSKMGFGEIYDRKSALTAAELLNDRVIPFISYPVSGPGTDLQPGRRR